MALSFTRLNGDGTTRQFAVPFGYLAREHVSLKVAGVTAAFVWLNDNLIEAAVAPASGTLNVLIKRTTPASAPAVVFTSPSNFTSEELNQSALQVLYITQEALDGNDLALTEDLTDGIFEGEGRRIKNIAAPVNADDVATKAWSETSMTSTLGQTIAARVAAEGFAAAAALDSENPVYSFTWSTNTAASNPGNGVVKGNNATLASITAIYISKTAVEGPVGNFLIDMLSSTSGTKGHIIVKNPQAPTNNFSFRATSFTDNSTYLTVTGVMSNANGTLGAGVLLSAFLVRTGDSGGAFGHGHVASDITDFTEASQDVVGALLGADGGDLDFTYDDGGNALGAVVKANAIATSKIPDQAVTFPKIVNASATKRLIIRKTAAGGPWEEGTESEALDFIGTPAHGGVLYRGAAGWEHLPPGTAGLSLVTGGAGANPAWGTQNGIDVIAQGTVTTPVATIDVAGTLPIYKKIEMQFNSLSHNNAGSTNLQIQLSENAGSSFLTLEGAFILNTNGSLTAGNQSGVVINCSTIVANNVVDNAFKFTIHEPGNSKAKLYDYRTSAHHGGVEYQMLGDGRVISSQPLNFLRFKFGAGNIDAGDYTILGYK